MPRWKENNLLSKELRELEEMEIDTLDIIEYLSKYPDLILDEYNCKKIRIDGTKQLVQRSVELKAEAEAQLVKIRSLISKVYLQQEVVEQGREED